MAVSETDVVRKIRSDYKYGFSNPDDAKDYFFKSGRGLSHEVVEAISQHKNEPAWMREFRHKSLDYFYARPLPTWGGNLAEIDFDNIYYYIRPTEKQVDKWEDLPAEILDTWDKLGIPEAEKQRLVAGARGLVARHAAHQPFAHARDRTHRAGIELERA